MNLFETLKQFKNITPDPQFTEKSKRMILAAPQNAQPAVAVRGVFVFLRALETAAALTLAGLFILFVTGFPGTGTLNSGHYSVIAPGSLRAEAQTIDMQIQLAEVNYAAVSSTAAESTAALAGNAGGTLALKSAPANSAAGADTSDAAASGTASSTGSSTLSVDQALEQLSQ